MTKQTRLYAPILLVLNALVCTFFCPSTGCAQTSDSTNVKDSSDASLFYRVVTRTGLYFYGRVIEEDGKQIVLNDVREGKVIILRKDVSQIDVYTSQEESVRRKNVSSKRFRGGEGIRYPTYNLSPHSAGVGGGNAVFQSSALTYNQIKYGITDQLDFELGTVFFAGPSFIGLSAHKEIVNRVYLSGGIKLGWLSLFDENLLSFPYLGAGIGGVHNSISVHHGVAFTLDQERVNVTLVAGQTSFIPYFDLFGEFVFLPQENFYFGQTYLRTTHRKSWYLDLGVVYSEGVDVFGIFPMIGGGYQLN